MAYVSNDLSVLAYANGFTLWHYTTPDATITGDNYFDPAADMVRVGDILLANLNTAATATAAFYRVATNSGGVVSLAAL